MWIFVSCLMVLSLILASCSTTEPTGGVEEEEGDNTVKITESETTTGTTETEGTTASLTR